MRINMLKKIEGETGTEEQQPEEKTDDQTKEEEKGEQEEPKEEKKEEEQQIPTQIREIQNGDGRWTAVRKIEVELPSLQSM